MRLYRKITLVSQFHVYKLQVKKILNPKKKTKKSNIHTTLPERLFLKNEHTWWIINPPEDKNGCNFQIYQNNKQKGQDFVVLGGYEKQSLLGTGDKVAILVFIFNFA